MRSCLAVVLVLLPVLTGAQTLPTLYIEPTEDQFEVYIAAAMIKKKVPITVMTKTEGVTYTLKTAAVQQEQVSTGGKVVNCLFMSCAGNADKARTSAQLIDAQGAIVWSYSVNKQRGGKNQQSMAESIAEHLKDDYLKKQR